MKNILKTFIAIFALTFIFTGCTEDDNKPSELNSEKYKQTSKVLKDDLNQIGLHLRNNNSNFLKRESVKSAAELNYGKNSDKLDEFLKNFNKHSSNYKTFNNLTDFQSNNVEEIIGALSNYSSLSEYQLFLDEKFEDLSNQTLEVNDKEFILNYITLFKVSLDFIENNKDLIGYVSDVNLKKGGWWSSWGKCVAGTVGGAITGALGGAAIGSAVPVIGTAAGGVSGAVGGALTGAAASC